MNHAPLLAGCLATFALGPAAVAQSFNFPTFASTTGLTLNGSATQLGTNLRVTNNGSAQTGSAWYTTPVSVTEGFETQFDFVLTTAPEGMAFVIHGSPAGAAALGGGLWGLGYGFGGTASPISNSIAIEIDRVQNGFLNDTSANEISIHTVGILGNSENEGVSIARLTPTINLGNSQVHRMRITYVPGTLAVYVDNLITPLLSTVFTFENGGTQLTGGNTGTLGLASTDAWVGFTSSTTSGTTGQNAELRSWTWVSFHLPHSCYVGNALVGSGGPYDLLKINGSNGGFFRSVQLGTGDPFTLSLAPPPSETSAPFVLLWTLGLANAATVTTTPWGLACFPPVSVLDIGGWVAPHSLAVPPGIILNLSFTLQAVMATDSSNPGRIDLTNAVGLEFSVAPPPVITARSPNSAIFGGTITITGSNFSLYATVDINGVPVTPLTVTTQQITFPMPAGVPCGATLRVRNPDGAASTIGFNPTPTITTQVTTSGPSAGGASFIVIGTGFAPGTTVTIGGNPATVSTAAATAVVATTPPGIPGPAVVVITTPGGCSVTSSYTYL